MLEVVNLLILGVEIFDFELNVFVLLYFILFIRINIIFGGFFDFWVCLFWYFMVIKSFMFRMIVNFIFILKSNFIFEDKLR